MAFSKLLIANRGEIAVRIMRSARDLGYRTVAVHSTADADARHVRVADQAVQIGPPAPAESYLVIERILEAARSTGADAIHPGYGFLAENAAFARACADAGIIFVGPPAEAIELMGDKRAAKLAAIQAGVPCVPGYEGADQSDETLIAEAKRIGMPVMIKATAGGGGRGMRFVNDEKELADTIRTARSEATNAFGSGELILEKAVIQPRHVEIQVFADTHGNVIHLGERDCSVQRRHQKVLEESPSPAVTPEIRAAMGEAAVAAARACNYVGAGTVEFLLDAAGNFYFLEMNTRLQVEHPVTECVTGTDLVAWQLRVAAGEALPMTQEELLMDGHAIEARLYAEDPAQQFMPQTGPVAAWQPAEGGDLRFDHGMLEGSNITPHYDPMVAKVIAWAPTRGEALRKLADGLRRTVLLGPRHNKGFLIAALTHPEFAAGNATTAFIAEHMADDPSMNPPQVSPRKLALSAVLATLRRAGPDLGAAGWRSASRIDGMLRLADDERTHTLRVRALGPRDGGHAFAVTAVVTDPAAGEAAPEPVEVTVLGRADGVLQYLADGVRDRLCWRWIGDELLVHHDDGDWRLRDDTYAPPQAAGGAGSGILTAPMDGAVVAVHAEAGSRVTAGQLVMVVEAMKMEHPVKADIDGTLSTLHVQAGDQVKPRQVVAEITADHAEDA